MKALDVYRAILRELDKHGSPTFTIKDFNHFINSAVDEYISNNYDQFDITAKDLMDLEPLYVLDAELTFTNGQASLPSDVRFPTTLVITQTLSRQEGPYAKNESVVSVAKRLRSNQRKLNNAFKTAALHYPRYVIANNKVVLSTVNYVSVSSGMFDYIKNPDTIYLADEGADYDQEENNTTIQFSDRIMKEIWKLCRRIFIENIENGNRYQSQIIEERLRKE